MKIYLSDCGSVLKAQIVDASTLVQVTGTLDGGYRELRHYMPKPTFSTPAYGPEHVRMLKANSGDVYGQMLSSMVNQLTPSAAWRMRSLSRRWADRDDTRSPTAHCRGGRYQLSNMGVYRFKAMKELYRELNVHVKASILGDADALVEFVMEHDGNDLIERMFGKIVDFLDGQVVLADCGHISRTDDITDVHRSSRLFSTMCIDCRGNDAVYCEDADEYYLETHAYRHSDGEWYSYEEERDEEEDEETAHNGHSMSYSADVLRYASADGSIRSSKYGDFTMGIELEMAPGRASRYDAIEDVRSQLGHDYCIIKDDGSISGVNGFEVVTAPRGLKEHITRFKAWDVNKSYRAWDVEKCGTHVHIDSRAFTELTLGKFLMFINSNNNADFIRNIAGRHPLKDSQAREYCANEEQGILHNPKQAILGKTAQRYYMVNLNNLAYDESQRLGFKRTYTEGKYNTIELRIFRATLKKERLLAQIEFTHACVHFCRSASFRELNGTEFVSWLKTTNNTYPHLSDWYGTRRPKQVPQSPALATTE
jgi:hypothetical protein